MAIFDNEIGGIEHSLQYLKSDMQNIEMHLKGQEGSALLQEMNNLIAMIEKLILNYKKLDVELQNWAGG